MPSQRRSPRRLQTPTAALTDTDESPPDALTQFLQEVAQLPAIHYRREYIPLVRRIRRGVLLRQLGGAAGPSTLPRLVRQLARLHARIDAAACAAGRPCIDLAALVLELDP